MNQNKHILLILLLFGANTTIAQQNLSLNDAVQRCLDANYGILIARNQQHIAENNNTSGNAGMMPRVFLDGEQSMTFNDSRLEFFNGGNQDVTMARNVNLRAALGAEWTIFDGMSMFANRERLKQLTLLSKEETRFYIEQSVSDLAIAYYQMEREVQLKEVLQNSLTVSQQRLQLEEKRFELGSGSLLYVQQAIVDRNADSALLLRQQNQIEQLYYQLNTIMVRPLQERFVLSDKIELKRFSEYTSLQEAALKNNANITSAQLREMIAEQQLKASRGAQFPELSLFAQYNFSQAENQAGFVKTSLQYGPTGGIRIRFNLYDGSRISTEKRNALIAQENALLEKNQVSNEINAALLTTWSNYQNALQMLNLESENLDAARSVLKIGQKQYELGSINEVQFRQIQLSALRAESNFLDAKFNAKSFEIDLLRLSGTLVQEIVK